MQRSLGTRLLLTTAFTSIALLAQGAGLTTLPPTGSHVALQSADVSADGSIVVGTLQPGSSTDARGFVWTGATGISNLAAVPDSGGGGNWFTATGISNAGTVVVGTASSALLGTNPVGTRAYRWTDAGGFVDLGTLGGPTSVAHAVSGDGLVVVGTSADSGGVSRAFRWSGGTIASLGSLSGETAAVANGASLDGSTIVGTSTVGSAKAFVWTSSGGMQQLAMLNSGTMSWAMDVSDDGNVIAGSALNGSTFQIVAVLWDNGTLHTMGSLHNSFGVSHANAISGNGEVIVGDAQDETYTYRAFRWTDGDGMISVVDWLRSSGAVIASDTTAIARGTNADGSVVIGEMTDGQLFIARGDGTGSSGPGDPQDPGDPDNPQPPGDPGIIGVNDLNASLQSTGIANASLVTGLGLFMNGAGSRPLDRLAPTHRGVIWLTGDLGRDDHATRDGSVGVGEIGGGFNFGQFQLNAAVGMSGSTQNTLLGGRTDVVSGYAKIEAMGVLFAPEAGSIWGILTGTALIGGAGISRNYVANGGLVQTSAGSAGVQGLGVRGRLQWQDAFPHVSPFGELSFAYACLDGYTETGGPFPASFNQVCDDAIEVRLGIDAEVPVTDDITLIATVEGVHRIDPVGTNVNGQVLGLGGFSLAAGGGPQTWLRGGLGVELDVGENGTFSIMGNATTDGQSASLWLAASLRMTL